MKKILSVVLAVCLLLTAVMFTSCGKKSPKEVVSEAVKKTQALDSYAANMSIEMDITAMGMSMNVPMDIVMEVEDAQTDAPKMKATVSMSMFGQEIEADTYSDGKWVYTEGQKTPVDANSDYSDDVSKMLQELPESVFVDKEFTENPDGSLTMDIELTSELFFEIFDEFAEDMATSAGATDNTEIDVKDIKLSITVADEYIKTYSIEYAMTLTVEGVETEARAVADLEFTKYGDVTVTFPDGYESYPEVAA